MTKKKKTKNVNPVPVKADYKQNLNYDVQKDINPDKINPNEIFDGVKSMNKKKQLKKICPKGHKVCKCGIKK